MFHFEPTGGGAEPEKQNPLLTTESTLFAVNSNLLFGKCKVALRWEKEDVDAAFYERVI